MTPRELYVQAKIDHYLARVEEYCSMARYLEARRLMDVVVSLDPVNQTSLSLRNRTDESFSELLRHEPGGNHRHATNVMGPGNGKGLHGLEGHAGALMVVVDQDERLLSQLAADLPRFGYCFAGAASFEEATELLSLIRPDIVVSEVNFDSGAKGCDLFSWMRTNPGLAETPFMFQATRLDTDVLLAGKRFGVDDFLLKPVEGAVLAAAVAHVLHRRRSASATV
jgi:CheY-like chemotaxis protein